MSMEAPLSNRVALQILLGFTVFCSASSALASERVNPSVSSRSRSPLQRTGFVENAGQWPAATRYAAKKDDLWVTLEKAAIGLHFPSGESADSAYSTIRLVVEEANPTVELRAESAQATRFHFYRGEDAADWSRDLTAYDAVVYDQIYPCISLRLRESDTARRLLEYDFLLEEGGAPANIALRCEGALALDISENGSLLVFTETGVIEQLPPVAWQESPGSDPSPVRCHYRLIDDQRFGFELESWDQESSLVIDPQVTYLGGTGEDWISAVNVNDAGEVLVTGFTNSPNFALPGGCSAPDCPRQFAGMKDIFVIRLTEDLSRALDVVFLGGSTNDEAIDAELSNGVLTVVGTTASEDFPVHEGFYWAPEAGFRRNAFVAQFQGTDLLYSSVLGGTGDDRATSVAVDPSGEIYMTGYTDSFDFPSTPGAFQEEYAGGESDTFVARVIPRGDLDDGDQLAYATYLGGSFRDGGSMEDNNFIVLSMHQDIAVTAAGDVVVAGHTHSLDFPVTDIAYQELHGGGPDDIFVTTLTPRVGEADQLQASTFLGGFGRESACEVRVLPDGDIIVVGDTESAWPDFGAFPVRFDMMYARFDPGLEDLIDLRVYGGSASDRAYCGHLTRNDRVILGGYTFSTDYPVSADAHQRTRAGSFDAGLVVMDAEGDARPEYGTYLGGSDRQEFYEIAYDDRGYLIAVGATTSSDVWTCDGAFDRDFDGGFIDGMVIRIPFSPKRSFVRGDCNADGTVDISDAVETLFVLLLGGRPPSCDDACDSNDDGVVDVSDPIATLSHLFLGQSAIKAPGTNECGADPTDDDRLDCQHFSECPVAR